MRGKLLSLENIFTSLRKHLPLISCVLCLILAWYLLVLPSDETLIAAFTAHRNDVAQVMTMLRDEPNPFIMSASGSKWLEDRQSIPLSEEQLDTYRVLLKRIGVTRLLGGGPRTETTFQIFTLFSRLGGPAKDIVYSQQRPSLITSGSTDWYTFQPGQYKRVCREIETDWYICKDYED